MNTKKIISIDGARANLRRTFDEYCQLENRLHSLENTNFRVCLFGSARITATDPLYSTVFELSRDLAVEGMDIVTGGGPGLMEAANAGVRAAQHDVSRSYGLTLDLPSLSEPPNPHLDIKSEHRRFSSRLDEFVRLSHGIVVAPGGIGTLLELMYVWQLLQVGLIERRPVVLFGREFWCGLMQWMEGMQVEGGFVSPGDMALLQVADDVEEVVRIMVDEQCRYQVEQFDNNIRMLVS